MIERLAAHVIDGKHLTYTQVRAADILMAKTIPSLLGIRAALEGSSANPVIARLTNASITDDD